MLRPERMSRVSVTGSKRVMDDAIEVLHDLDLLHISEYENEIDGFEPGSSMAGADGISDKLVTVRSLESILDVDDDADVPPHRVTDEEIEEELPTVRSEVNDLDDRQDDLQTELREIEEEIDQFSVFVDLGIDLELLSGYDSLEVAVGEGDPDTVRGALEDSDIAEYEVFAGSEAVAVFARVENRDELDDALVGATFTAVEVPDGEGDPEAYLDDLYERADDVEDELEDAEDELEDLREEYGGFLLAVEEQLTIEAEKLEAPLSFATTENAFVVEGWLPTADISRLESALTEAVGDSVVVEELEQAAYDDEGHVEEHEPVESTGGNGGATITEADTEDDTEREEPPKAAADGGYVALADDDPPVVQDNPGGVRPFESLVEVINRPKYSELDPTVILFLTFPPFFGFMIGDLGYGLLYMGLGYWIMRSFDSDVIRALGAVGLWAGAFTALFGVLYGEFFGLHQLGDILWDGKPPIHKGLQPHYSLYAKAWLLMTLVLGVVHLVVGRLFDFVNNLSHGLKDAVFESGSWILMTLGVWLWVFSTQASGSKPDFIFTVFGSGEEAALKLGFTGVPPVELFTVPGLDFPLSLWLVLLFVGLAMALVAEGGIALIESITEAFGHVVSYTRITAVLLAKAGMALAVNLLVFGAFKEGEPGEEEFPLIFFKGAPEETEAIIFQGLLNLDGPVGLILGVTFGIVVLVLGHALVLVLGITSAGLQAIRLEYVEFFGKFYEGGGDPYTPFGHDRTYTGDE